MPASMRHWLICLAVALALACAARPASARIGWTGHYVIDFTSSSQARQRAEWQSSSPDIQLTSAGLCKNNFGAAFSAFFPARHADVIILTKQPILACDVKPINGDPGVGGVYLEVTLTPRASFVSPAHGPEPRQAMCFGSYSKDGNKWSGWEPLAPKSFPAKAMPHPETFAGLIGAPAEGNTLRFVRLRLELSLGSGEGIAQIDIERMVSLPGKE